MRKAILFIVCICINLAVFSQDSIKTGADQTNLYLNLIKGKNVALVSNHTSIIGTTHLADSLLNTGIKIVKIFFPEHGFRGDKDAGAYAGNYIDKKTGITCISLYGKENRKPKKEDLKDIDIVVFDLQDVGVRFYTYLSTLHYTMEACAENNLPLIVLDRPNPNGFYIDGPVLNDSCKSFVGMHPVPIVYGMTIGEYATMINGEKWLNEKMECKLTVIPLKNYTHKSLYKLPVKPSPNLSTMNAIYFYPSLCLFEGTIVSVGRGTTKPFEQFGYPKMAGGNTQFTPTSIKGASSNPPYKGQKCSGILLTDIDKNELLNNPKLELQWLITAYQSNKQPNLFFNNYFKNLAGTSELKKQIEAGISIEKIRESWEPALIKFKTIRKKYLLYPDFN